MADLAYYKKYIKGMGASVKGEPTLELLNDLKDVVIIMVQDFDKQLAEGTIKRDLYLKWRDYAFEQSKWVKSWANTFFGKTKDEKYSQLFWYVMGFEAHYLLDSYMLYLEKNRPIKEQFYRPRRKQLLKVGIVQALQDIEDDKIDILTISMPPGSGKTTFEKFFLTWIFGKHPELYNLFYSHSDGITQMFYQGILDIVQNPDYCFNEIFPNVKVTNTNAKEQQINFNKYKPFPNLQTGTIKSNMAGRVRCNGYLLCDDLIGKMEQALNKVYLDKLWQVMYVGDAKQRKMTGCKEIHIATRWSVHDVIGRLQQTLEKDNRARFLTVDCYDKYGKSQFDYDYGVGLSTEFLHEQEEFFDDISFRCLYRNQPIEREGLLYHSEDLRRFLSIPEREPDAILGVCDTKEKGTDYMFLPVFYQYDNDFYLVDCLCSDNSDYGVQYGRLTDLILRHNMQQVQFESNVGGNRVAYEVEQRVKAKGGRCNITTKPTETNKETKIIVNADWVKKNVLFKDADNYKNKDEYGLMMSQLLSYSTVGKNNHDDIPDCLAMFALYVTGKYRRRETVIMQSPI